MLGGLRRLVKSKLLDDGFTGGVGHFPGTVIGEDGEVAIGRSDFEVATCK